MTYPPSTVTVAEPPITVEAYHRTPGVNTPVSRIVIHCTSPRNGRYPSASAEGMARGTALYFTLASSGGSAHYIEDVAAEEHCLRDEMIAWHAPPNPHSLGIEICGMASYTREQWLSDQVWPAVRRAKDRALELHGRHNVPWRRLTVADLRRGEHGICGHVEVAKAFLQSHHTDPGDGFPWDVFMADTPAPPSPLPPVVDFPGGHMQRVPVRDPANPLGADGTGFWDLDGGAPGRPKVLFSELAGQPFVNGADGYPAGDKHHSVEAFDHGGFVRLRMWGFEAGSVPLIFVPVGL